MTDKFRELVVEVVREELAKLHAKPANDQALTVAEYARRYSISERTVRDAIRDGRLDHLRIGRAVRIPTDAKIGPRVDAVTARARLVLMGGKR